MRKSSVIFNPTLRHERSKTTYDDISGLFLGMEAYVTSVLLASFLHDWHTNGQVSFFFMCLANGSNSFMNEVTNSVIDITLRLKIKQVLLKC